MNCRQTKTQSVCQRQRKERSQPWMTASAILLHERSQNAADTQRAE